MSNAKCNFQCYKDGTCPYPDCIVNELTIAERLEQDNRDRSFTSYGTAVIRKASRGKHKYNIMTY